MDKLTKSETQVLIDYVKGMIQDNKEPEKKSVIALCDELVKIDDELISLNTRVQELTEARQLKSEMLDLVTKLEALIGREHANN